MDRWKAAYAQKTHKRTLAEVIEGADVFLGLSAAGVLKPEYLAGMAELPLIMALANPNPEIMPDLAQAVRPDAMICTGRSDFPNQVNNVLCFPYIFRGALDVGATTINEEMKAAAVKAIAALARETPSEVVARAYGGEARPFGKESLIPSPFDPPPDPAHRPRGGQGRHGLRRRRAPAARPEGLRGVARRLRLPLGLPDEAPLRRREGRAQARDLCRGRGRARAARRAGGDRGGHRPADPHRPPLRRRDPAEALRALPRDRPRRRPDQPRGRPALPRLRRHLSRDRRAPGHHPGRPRARWCAPTPP